MRSGVARQAGETGLSEVIGFVMIIAVLTVIASLYLTYGVPAAGRENEIIHMNTIRDEFVEYKLSLDSLYDNKKVGTTLGNTFTLGTSGGYTQGQTNVIFPLMNPINAGGIMAINQRTPTPETLNLSSQSLILNSTTNAHSDLPARFNNTPSHIYVNISNIQASDLSSSGRFGTTVSSGSWVAYINLSPQTTFYQWYKFVKTDSSSTPCTSGMDNNGTANPTYGRDSTGWGYGCLVPMNAYTYNGTDLTVTVKKGNLVTMQDYIVSRNLKVGSTYTVDLMDDVFGLASSIFPPDIISIKSDKPSPSSLVTATGNITYNYVEVNPYTVTPIYLGAVEYRSTNNYWINQKYFYQTGGVFLSQQEGNATFKLPPRISLSYTYSLTDPSKNITTVDIDALTIDPNDAAIVGGSSPVQVKSTLDNITALPYAAVPTGAGNTKWIRIGVNTSDTQVQAMWKNYFDSAASVNKIPNYQTGMIGNESYILINGYDTTNTLYDINVIASQATFSALIHGAAQS